MQTLNATKQLTTPDGTTFVVVESDSSNDGSEIVFEITMAPARSGRHAIRTQPRTSHGPSTQGSYHCSSTTSGAPLLPGSH